ncbi:MAG: hypothetical protein AB7T31_10220 [Gemmatimonadales bacterium]
MDTTWLDLGGVLVANPMNAATNVFLAAQCAIYALILRRHQESGADEWATFLSLLSLATGAGAVKHGFGYALDAATYEVVLAVTNVAGGLSTYFAQLATLRRRPYAQRPLLRTVAYVQVCVFFVANLVVGPELLLLIANTVVGLVPVIVIEGRAAPGLRSGSAMIALGLLVATLAGLVYLVDVSLGPWFNHIDLAHAVMAVSFHAIAWGAGPGAPSGSVPACESWTS